MKGLVYLSVQLSLLTTFPSHIYDYQGVSGRLLSTTKMHSVIQLLLVFMCVIRLTDCLFIEGCPLFGCRPSGSFSMYLDVSRKNTSVAWETNFVLDPVPNALGCVANDVSTICQSNGPFKEDTGYVSLNGLNGRHLWRDKELHFPPLPILDNYGDLTGSDGLKLVHYDENGKLYPIISCDGLRPVLSLQLVGTDFLLLVSEHGEIVVRDTNGVPVGSLFLKAVIQKVNGTFVPISQPVVNGYRFYLLTKFVPETDMADTLELQRLYAIDVHHSLLNRITIGWHYDFERQTYDQNNNIAKYVRKNKFKLLSTSRTQRPRRNKDMPQEQILMWDNSNKLLYINLPNLSTAPGIGSDSGNAFLALRDSGNHSSLAFRLNVDIKHMAKFETNTDIGHRANKETVLLWLISSNGTCFAVESNGSVTNIINMTEILGIDILVTSKVVLIRSDDHEPDILVFAFQSTKPSTKFRSVLSQYGMTSVDASNFIVAINTPVNNQKSNDVIQWMVSVPSNMTVKGQITGSRGASTGRQDQIVLYAEDIGKSAKVFAVR